MEQIISAIIGAVVALVTFLVSNWVAQKQHEQAQTNKSDELFMTALTFLDGKTQRRNVGIAAITLYLEEDSRHIQLCREILIGAAIYLLNETKQRDKLHEIYNLKRIMNLIIKKIPTDEQSLLAYKELKESLSRWRPKTGDDLGLHLEKSLINVWKEELSVQDENELNADAKGG